MSEQDNTKFTVELTEAQSDHIVDAFVEYWKKANAQNEDYGKVINEKNLEIIKLFDKARGFEEVEKENIKEFDEFLNFLFSKVTKKADKNG